jgi:hypothetical protein
VQIFSVRHIQFIVKNTFKATCFDSTEPPSSLFVRTDPYLITVHLGPQVFTVMVYIMRRLNVAGFEIKIQININPYPAIVENMVSS